MCLHPSDNIFRCRTSTAMTETRRPHIQGSSASQEERRRREQPSSRSRMSIHAILSDRHSPAIQKERTQRLPPISQALPHPGSPPREYCDRTRQVQSNTPSQRHDPGLDHLVNLAVRSDQRSGSYPMYAHMSMASASIQRGQPRPPRYRYSGEEPYFLYYHKRDLGLPWDSINELYDQHFGNARSKGGLQCKFYRILSDWNMSSERSENRTRRRRPSDEGSTALSIEYDRPYPWMRAEHQEQVMRRLRSRM